MSQSTKYDKVREFYAATKIEQVPNAPTAIKAPRRAQLMSYLMEEVLELGKAAELPDQVDAAVDLLYFVMDVFVELGVNPDVPFDIVHTANMSKLWPDGCIRVDYSIVPPRLIKPPGWQPPEPQIHEYLLNGRNRE